MPEVCPPPPPQPSQQPVLIYAPPAPDNLKEQYAARTVRIFGLVQILGGALCIIAQIVAIHVGSQSLYASAGIWTGALYCLTGAFGVFSGKYGTRCWIITYMVFCIIASVFTFAIIISCSVALGIDNWGMRHWFVEYSSGRREFNQEGYNTSYRTAMTFNALMVITAVVELVLLIWGSALACKVMCCGGQQPQGVVMLPVQYADGQAIVLSSGQAQAPAQPAFAANPPEYGSQATAPLVPTEEKKGAPQTPPPAYTEQMPDLQR